MLARFRAMDQIGAHVQGVFRTLDAFVSFFVPLRSASRVGYSGPCDNQVIGGWGPGVTETTPSQVVFLFAKPCRMTGVYDNGAYGVCRTGCLVRLPRR